MFMCHIGGHQETFGFGNTEEEAIAVAIKHWKKLCATDVKDWTPDQIKEWCGLNVVTVKAGFYYDNYGETGTDD